MTTYLSASLCCQLSLESFFRKVMIGHKLQFTKQKLQTVTEEKDRIDFDLEELEQYTRKNSLEIHGIPHTHPIP